LIALPAHWYCDPATVALERRAIFDRGWQLLAHASRLRAPGDHVVVDFAGLPVVAVRGADGTVRAFHNVCRHRAGPIATCDGSGARALRCRYHGWTYGLDGRLKSAPEMAGADDFDPAAIRLPALAVREWQGLLFAAVDAEAAAPFDDLVAGIAARMGDGRDLPGYGHHHHASYEIDCNWKVYVDNFLEGYHLPHVHPELNRILDYRSYRTELAPWHALQWSPLESGEGLYGNGDALYYWLWPNTMLNVLPGRLQTNRVVPLGPGRCRVEFDTCYPDSPEGADARRDADIAFSDEVQHEDIAICEAVQRGLASGSYATGPLNPVRETGVAHFHQLLRTAYREQQQQQQQPATDSTDHTD
jgi:choline monooxygenase